MTHSAIITTSRYNGVKVYEFAKQLDNYFMVELGGILQPQKFWFLADAFNFIDDYRKNQLEVFTPVHH